jgi:hypothetical protein
VIGPVANTGVPSLPCVVHPGEIFAFPGVLREPGAKEFAVSFDAEFLQKTAFYVKIPAVKVVARSLVCVLDSPPTAIRFNEFRVEVVIEKSAEFDDSPEVATLSMEVSSAVGFFINGPSRRHFSLFRGQKMSIPITLMPLDAGPMTLPAIVISDTAVGGGVVKRFLVPIVVTYQ